MEQTRYSNTAMKILAHCPESSTRVLLEISLDADQWAIEYAQDENKFVAAVEKRSHDVYIIDAGDAEGDARLKLLRRATSQKLKGLVRFILLIDKVSPPAANRMHPFGPLCFLECFFTKARLNDTLKVLLDLRDTGVRVKSDPNFFDVKQLEKK
jgi:hypothetical protein